jgi:hypothetical protein
VADLATIPAYLAPVLAAIAAVVAQLAAFGVGGLGDSDCRGTSNQREGQHDEATHGHVLLGSADQTKTGCRR